MTRKEKSKIICKQLSINLFGYKDNEDIYVAAVMNGLKEIEELDYIEHMKGVACYERETRD